MREIRLPPLAVAICLLSLAACTHTAQRYGSSAENVVALQEMRKSATTTIQVAPFSSFQPGMKEILCRAAGPVEAPDGKPFETYLRDAMVSELRLAGLYADQAGSVLNGHLEHIDFSSNIGAGNWTIRVRFSREGAAPFTVEHTHPFSTNFIADIACEQVAQQLGPATQDFLRKTFSHPAFGEIFHSKRP